VNAEPTDADRAAAERIIRNMVRPHYIADVISGAVAQALADARAEGYAAAARAARDIANDTGALNAADQIRTHLIGETQ
jgi:hypothetical protein